MKNIFILLIFSLFLVSCSGIDHKIAFSGEYEGITGSIEYTFSPQDSKKVGVPALTSPQGGKKFLLSESQIEKLAEIKPPEISAKTKETGETKAERLLQQIKK